MKKFVMKMKNVFWAGAGLLILLLVVYVVAGEAYHFFARPWNLDDWVLAVSVVVTLALFGPLVIHEEILRRRIARRSSQAQAGGN
ncbi:hypothetical protein HZB93_00875 [Candidatus Falkowbacteria bacterium]|nr:hypothetical protein [Candidatus Falkowbacteria bacterium]